MFNTLCRNEVREIYNWGKREGCFEVLSAQKEREVRSGVHNYAFTQLAYNPKSRTMPVRFITNPSNSSPANPDTLNNSQARPPNLNNRMQWVLKKCKLFSIPYTTDISHAYQQIQLHEDQ